MLTPREYAFADTPPLQRAMGLEVRSGGWGILMCTDPAGQRWTIATRDAEYVRVLVAAQGPTLAGMTIPPGKFTMQARGWPDEWARDPEGVVVWHDTSNGDEP